MSKIIKFDEDLVLKELNHNKLNENTKKLYEFIDDIILYIINHLISSSKVIKSNQNIYKTIGHILHNSYDAGVDNYLKDNEYELKIKFRILINYTREYILVVIKDNGSGINSTGSDKKKLQKHLGYGGGYGVGLSFVMGYCNKFKMIRKEDGTRVIIKFNLEDLNQKKEDF